MKPCLVLFCYVQGQQSLVSKLKAINEAKYSFHAAQDYGYICIIRPISLCYI
jgi:hypothetical protein